jgi:hypothetical protein
MSKRFWAALLPLLGFILPASAAVYRCDGDPPRFQDAPCGSTGVASVVPAAGGGSGLRRSERNWLRTREAARQAAKPKRSQRRSGSGKVAQQEQRCWRKRQQLERVKAKLRRGYKPAQGERLRRSRKQYEEYLFRYCG